MLRKQIRTVKYPNVTSAICPVPWDNGLTVHKVLESISDDLTEEVYGPEPSLHTTQNLCNLSTQKEHLFFEYKMQIELPQSASLNCGVNGPNIHFRNILYEI